MQSASIHTFICISALVYDFIDGLIIPGFWVRIPEGPPEYFEAGRNARPLCICPVAQRRPVNSQYSYLGNNGNLGWAFYPDVAQIVYPGFQL